MKTKTKAIQLDPSRTKVNATERIVEGYASVFGVLDSHGDIVERGAFANFLSKLADAGDVPLLYQHKSSEVIGKHLSLKEDERGLHFTAKIAPTKRGDEVLALLEGGFIKGVSIGFDIEDAEMDKDNPVVRRLKQLNLWENSIVTFPSNTQARAENVRDTSDVKGSDRKKLAKGLSDLETSLSKSLDAVKSLKSMMGEDDEKALPMDDEDDDEDKGAGSKPDDDEKVKDPAEPVEPDADTKSALADLQKTIQGFRLD